MFESPLFYSHYNREGKVMVIPFAMRTRQGDPLGGALFALVHFKALCSTVNGFPYCLFPSNVDDIHIIGPPSIEIHEIGLSIQPQKVQHGHPLVYYLTLTPHPYLTPHQKELGPWGFHWVPRPSHHLSSKVFY